ncbi:MAG: transcriptional regulator [Rhodospirillales bacterium]|jgi:transcriptional regulator with XRE-family HTH domain|nr:transcriptional regulator [Rhodospirillales bacterium]
MAVTRRDETVEIFRERLDEVIRQSGLRRSAFARRIGIDRSTLTQLLSAANDRLPRAETIAAIAADQQVSVDWLLGLTQEGPLSADLMPQPFEIEVGGDMHQDERLQRWHAEAAGYKIRYVPASLPDLLKSEPVIRYEYREQGAGVPQARLEEAGARLAYLRRPETDMEVCSTIQSVEDFARGHSQWTDLPRAERKRAMSVMIERLEELYPTLRWFLFDRRTRYSVPLTIFGPKRAAIYMGNMYFVLNSTEHIRLLTRHFDELIRAAALQPRDTIEFLRNLMKETA